jgi:hypothetical protein
MAGLKYHEKQFPASGNCPPCFLLLGKEFVDLVVRNAALFFQNLSNKQLMSRYFTLFIICSLAVCSLTHAQAPKPPASIAREQSELGTQMQRRTDLVVTLANLLKGTSFEPKDSAIVVLSKALTFKGFFNATPWINEVNVARICLEYNQVHDPLVNLLQQLDKQPDLKKMEFIKDLLTPLSWSENKLKELTVNYNAVCKKYNRQDMLLPKSGLKSVKVNL